MNRPGRAARTDPEPLGPTTDQAVAAAVVRTLSRQQRRAIFGESGSVVADQLAQRRQAIRDAKADRPPAGLAAERTEATQISQGIEWAMAPLQRILGTAFLILGWAWLLSGLLAIGIAFLFGGAPASEQDSWSFAGLSGVLFMVCVVTFPLAGLALLMRNSLDGLQKRRQRAALLRWAAQRPGQLARGLPGWPPASGYGDGVVAPPLSGWLNLAKWIFGVIAAFCLPVGLAVALIGLIVAEAVTLQIGGLFVGAGLVGGALSWGLHRLVRRIKHADRLADKGLRWVWEGKLPQDAHQADQDTS